MAEPPLPPPPPYTYPDAGWYLQRQSRPEDDFRINIHDLLVEPPAPAITTRPPSFDFAQDKLTPAQLGFVFSPPPSRLTPFLRLLRSTFCPKRSATSARNVTGEAALHHHHGQYRGSMQPTLRITTIQPDPEVPPRADGEGSVTGSARPRVRLAERSVLYLFCVTEKDVVRVGFIAMLGVFIVLCILVTIRKPSFACPRCIPSFPSCPSSHLFFY
jgi:hypothetical protein